MLTEVRTDSPRTASRLAAPRVRTVRVGLIGLGNVGQAVARLAPEAQRLETSGVRFSVAGALVRDIARERRCARPRLLTSDPNAFLRGRYDVVIDTLPGIEPARTIVRRLLGRGVSVVTANKALVAAHGPELVRLAARCGAALRYEASALAAVPFLGALAERPYVADVSRFTAVVNGTSNFILSTIDAERCAFDQALAQAQHLGLTEPDPSRDLTGLDAADKLALVATLFGWGQVAHPDVEVRGIDRLAAEDLQAARALGGTIKPVVCASRADECIEAFVGPAFVDARHPLASLGGALSGIQLSGRYVSDLFFSGPGAGPDVTAATILDDAVEAVSTRRRFRKPPRLPSSRPGLRAPDTAWFVRAAFPGVLPESSAAAALFSSAGLTVTRAAPAHANCTWLLVDRVATDHLERARVRLRHTHRIETLAIRSI